MPKWLVLSAAAAVIVLIVVMTLLNKRSLEQPGQPASRTVAAASTAAQPSTPRPAQTSAPPAVAPAANAPVLLTAIAPAWVQVSDQGKTLFEGMMNAGQTYNVPPTATAPELKAGKPEALRIMVGSAVAPPVGPPGKVASHVSLKPADLMRGPPQAGAAAPANAPAPAAPAQPTQ